MRVMGKGKRFINFLVVGGIFVIFMVRLLWVRMFRGWFLLNCLKVCNWVIVLGLVLLIISI